MRTVIQRVKNASVSLDCKVHQEISNGLLIFIGITESDTENDSDWLANKVCNLRIFADEHNHMNKSVKDVDGEILIISQFTLHASTKKGNRPSFIKAAKPDIALPLYNYFIQSISNHLGKAPKTGVFGGNMQVELVNDGPVTIIIDTDNKE